VVNNLEPQVRALCNKYLDIIGDKKEFNAGDEYAQFISPGVIKVMLGFPDEDEDKFREFVHIVLEGVDEPDVEKRMEQFQPVADYIEAQVADHRANPRDDLTTFLINAEIDGQKLPDEMIFGAVVLTLIAGIDTTWSAIASSLWHLATNPADRERLINEPELMPLAVEEFLRYYSPVTMARLVKEDFNFHGVDMKKDDWVLLGFPIANRDPKAFEDADKFIIDRKVNRHVAFGLGIHRCAGSNLARMELRIAIEEFLKRYKNFELSDPKGVTWSQGQVRGARSLPFRILD
jgi:cytochrome P450